MQQVCLELTFIPVHVEILWKMLYNKETRWGVFIKKEEGWRESREKASWKNQTCLRASVINKTTEAVAQLRVGLTKPRPTKLSDRGVDGQMVNAATMSCGTTHGYYHQGSLNWSVFSVSLVWSYLAFEWLHAVFWGELCMILTAKHLHRENFMLNVSF